MYELSHSFFAVFIVRIGISERTFYIEIGQQSWISVPRTCDEECLLLVFSRDLIEMQIDKIDPRHGSPVAQDSFFYV